MHCAAFISRRTGTVNVAIPIHDAAPASVVHLRCLPVGGRRAGVRVELWRGRLQRTADSHGPRPAKAASPIAVHALGAAAHEATARAIAATAAHGEPLEAAARRAVSVVPPLLRLRLRLWLPRTLCRGAGDGWLVAVGCARIRGAGGGGACCWVHVGDAQQDLVHV